jgi:hypothetical protein
MTQQMTTSIFLVMKIFILIGLAMYAVFAGIIVRQEQRMASVLEEHFEPILRLITVIHFIASLVVAVIALFFL